MLHVPAAQRDEASSGAWRADSRSSSRGSSTMGAALAPNAQVVYGLNVLLTPWALFKSLSGLYKNDRASVQLLWPEITVALMWQSHLQAAGPWPGATRWGGTCPVLCFLLCPPSPGRKNVNLGALWPPLCWGSLFLLLLEILFLQRAETPTAALPLSHFARVCSFVFLFL